MAEVRKSATQTAARKRARERAASFREKQETLEQLAANYFIATDEAVRIRNTGLEELKDLQDRIDNDAAAVLEGAEKIICAMLDLGAPKTEVADRLGVANRHIRQAIANHGAPTTARRNTTSTPESETAAPAPNQ